MKILKRTTVSDWKKFPDNTSQMFPGIAVTPTGRIIVTYRSAPQKNRLEGQHVLYSISDDGGNSWSEPQDMFTPPVLNGCPGTFRMGQPSWINGKLCILLCWVDNSIPGRRFFKEENQGLLDCRLFFVESTDNGESWSDPEYIDTAPFGHLSTPVTGPLLALSDGEIFAQFELNKPYDSTDEWRHLPVLKFSKDQGKTFYRHAIPAADPANYIFYWDQRPMVLKDDTIVDFFWTWDNESSTYFNIHMSYSSDRGMSWSGVLDTGVSGQPGQPVEFADGSLLMPLVDRTGNPRIVSRISFDQGKTFSSEILDISTPLDKMQTAKQANLNGAWREMGNFSLGLPAGAASNHDTAYVVWYAGEDTDRTSIEFAEIAR